MNLEFRVETTGYARVIVDTISVGPQLPSQIYKAFAQAYFQQGDVERALPYLIQALDNDPVNVRLRMALVNTFIAQERWDEVEQFLSGHVSRYHTGFVTVLHSAGSKNLLPESLQRMYNQNISAFTPEQALDVQFGEKLALIGYDLQNERMVPGGEFFISYYWKALEAMDENYVIFVHFIRRERNVLEPETITRLKRKFRRPITDWFQQDHEPLSGVYPTSQWIPGELIREEYTVTIPPDLEPGEYDGSGLAYGIRLTEARLSTAYGKNKVHIGTFWIDD